MKFSRKFIFMVVIFILLFTIVFPFLYNKGINGNKGKEFYSSCQSDCNPSNLLNPSNSLNPIILPLIPQTLYDNDGVTITINKNYTNGYVYVKKNCDIKPITIVLNTFCDIVISDINKINNIIGIPIPIPITSLSLKNVYVSAELFIDCSGDRSKLQIKDLFVDMSYQNPQTSIDTGNDNINNLLNDIITNNSHIIDIISPDCKNTNLATCVLNSETNQYACTYVVNQINSLIKKDNLPKIDIPSSTISTISLICGS